MTDSGGVPLVVIDAGHGGPDAGASSAHGVKEAGINLTIAKLVESGLREAGFAVKMTRSDENAIGDSKREDMQARRDIMRSDGCRRWSHHMKKFGDTSIRGTNVRSI
jgi:N-acetylmuramoyl-L-alanine amidase